MAETKLKEEPTSTNPFGTEESKGIRKENPAPKGWFARTVVRVFGNSDTARLTASQIISEVTGALVTWIYGTKMHPWLATKFPTQMSSLNAFTAHNIITPFQGIFEWVARKSPNLRHDIFPKSANYDTIKGQDRIDAMSGQVSKFGVGIVTGFLANTATQWYVDKKLHVQQDSLAKTMAIKVYADELPKLGCILLLNTLGKRPAKAVIDMLEKVLGKGLAPQAASDTAGLAVNYLVPDAVATTINIFALRHHLQKKHERDNQTAMSH